MKSFHIYAFSDEAGSGLGEQIAALKRNSLEGMEIRTVDKKNVSDMLPDEVKEIRKALDAEGLRVRSVGSPIGKMKMAEDYSAHLDKFKRTLESANILGADRMRIFSFYIPKGEDPEDYRDTVIDRLGEMLEIAKACGVTLCHENEKGIYGDIASRCEKLHKALPRLRAVFDPANFIQCGQPTLEAFEALNGYIDYLHIKDSLPDGRIVPAGMGAGEVEEILRRTKSVYLTVEPHLKVFDGFAGLQQESSLEGIKIYPDNASAFDDACEHLKALTAKL